MLCVFINLWSGHRLFWARKAAADGGRQRDSLSYSLLKMSCNWAQMWHTSRLWTGSSLRCRAKKIGCQAKRNPREERDESCLREGLQVHARNWKCGLHPFRSTAEVKREILVIFRILLEALQPHLSQLKYYVSRQITCLRWSPVKRSEI